MNNFCYNILVDFDINLDHINQIKKDNSNMVGVNSFQVYKTNVDKTLRLFLNHYNVGISFSEVLNCDPTAKAIQYCLQLSHNKIFQAPRNA
jgi:hypothetical protein